MLIWEGGEIAALGEGSERFCFVIYVGEFPENRAKGTHCALIIPVRIMYGKCSEMLNEGEDTIGLIFIFSIGLRISLGFEEYLSI
jgi:hypothetical protein